MTEPIAPALTPEQWKVVQDEPGLWVSTLYYAIYAGPDEKSGVCPSEHGQAAIALHGQPFGFTQEDVEALHDAATEWNSNHAPYIALKSIAAKIAALLPPAP